MKTASAGAALVLAFAAGPALVTSACGPLAAFINDVAAREGSGSLTTAQANELRSLGQSIGSRLGC